MKLRVLSLFSGIGGFDLGLERAGMQVVGQCEMDPFCQAVLANHWPGVECWTSIQALLRELRNGRRIPVDVVCGGFPCQDISCAGLGRGLDAARSGLWWKMCECIVRISPDWLLIENVPALKTRGYDRVANELERRGYALWPVVVGARHVGAPHRRDRIWIVGRFVHAECYGGRDGGAGHVDERCTELANPQKRGRGAGRGLAGSEEEEVCRGSELARGGQLADAESKRREGEWIRGWPARPGEPQHAWEAQRLVEFSVGGSVDGLPSGLVGLGENHAIETDPLETCARPSLWTLLREVRKYGSPERPPSEQEPGRQLDNEHGNIMPFLSQQGARAGTCVSKKSEAGSEATVLRMRKSIESQGPLLDAPVEALQAWESLSSESKRSASDRIAYAIIRRIRRHNRNGLKALGNAVVPQVAEAIGRAIVDADGWTW